MKYLSVLLLAIAISQGTNAETIPDLVQEFTSLIENRVSEIGQLISKLGTEIGKTSGTIEKNIKVAAQQLSSQIDAIGDLVNDSIARAAQLGKNIGSCVSDVESSISSLNLDVLNKCEPSEELANVKKLISELGRLPRQLGILIPKCITGILKDVSSVRTCLNEGLQLVDDKVSAVTADAVTLVEGALDTANKCIDGAVSEVNGSITTITNGLNKCVNDIISS